MNRRCLLTLVLVAVARVASIAAEPATKVRLEMWKGCLCGGQQCSRTYDKLNGERAERMLFGADVTLTNESANRAPLDLLKRVLGGSDLKARADLYWMGVVYRRGGDGQSYSVHFRGGLSRFKVSEAKDGDLIIYFQERY
jgi:hypothetical protein